MSDDDRRLIELEMTYTPFISCCKDPALTPTGVGRLCRRHVRHEGPHASGFGASLYLWTEQS